MKFSLSLMVIIFFTSQIQAQRNALKFPVFEECLMVDSEKLEQCFYDTFHEKFSRNTVQSSNNFKGIDNSKTYLLFNVDHMGKFHVLEVVFPDILDKEIKVKVIKSIENTFTILPRVQSATWSDGNAIVLYFRSELKIDISLDGDLKSFQIITTEVLPSPPPAPEMIGVKGDDPIIEEVILGNYEEVVEVVLDHDTYTDQISDVPFAIIEKAPIYIGCESEVNNADRKKCMSEAIMEFVHAEFNQEIAQELGLSGKVKIYVQFKIDSKGSIIDIHSRAKHPRLKTEAERVVNLLPKMTPGTQRGKAVGTIYALPFVFDVQD